MNDDNGMAHRPTATVSMILVGVVALVIFGACTSERGWTKAGAVETDFNRDSYECAREATYISRRAALANGAGFVREETMVGKDLYHACMRARGYQFVEGGQWRGFQGRNIGRSGQWRRAAQHLRKLLDGKVLVEPITVEGQRGFRLSGRLNVGRLLR
jgi:hypothetical protein